MLQSLSNTIIHAPGGDPLHAPEDVQATFLVRFGEFLNYLRHNQLSTAMELETEMCKRDLDNHHVLWREKIIEKYRYYNKEFPENFKIKCKTTKITDLDGSVIERPDPDSFLCMLDYFRNILVHLPLKGLFIIYFEIL